MASAAEEEGRGAAGMASATTTNPSVLASKRVLHVAGLADKATAALVRAAFVPFGPIASVDLPMDYVKGAHRGFCFVEYHDADDAEEAVFNMDGAELLGRVLRVSLAQPNQAGKLGGSGGSGAQGATEAVWNSDEWFQKHIAAPAGDDEGPLQQQLAQRDDALALR